jgi:hypothetical protein
MLLSSIQKDSTEIVNAICNFFRQKRLRSALDKRHRILIYTFLYRPNSWRQSFKKKKKNASYNVLYTLIFSCSSFPPKIILIAQSLPANLIRVTMYQEPKLPNYHTSLRYMLNVKKANACSRVAEHLLESLHPNSTGSKQWSFR